MPSSKTKRSKDLHLATSIGELNKLSDIDPGIKAGRDGNAKLFCKSADKVFLKAEEHDLDSDEEQAYVLYMRYFNIISLMKKTKQYLDNKKYYQDLLGTAKPKRAVERAEVLQTSLAKRYEELQTKQEEEAQELAKRTKQEAEKGKTEKQHITNSQGNNVGNANIDDHLDDVLNGWNPISTSSDVYQRLKVEHSTPLTPQNSGRLPNDQLLPSVESGRISQNAPSISALELYNLFQTSSPTSLLILDTRSRKDYSECHIQHRSSISIPGEMIDQGVSVGNIERRLSERTRVMWKERSKKEFIVILDKSTKASDVTPASKIQCLKDAIYKYDSYTTLQKEPVFLDGGFDSWLWHYPSLTTNPQLPKVITSGVSKAVIPDLSSLDYPELPGYEAKSLPAAPVTNVSQTMNVVRPVPAPRTDRSDAISPPFESNKSTSYQNNIHPSISLNQDLNDLSVDLTKLPTGTNLTHSNSVPDGRTNKVLVPERVDVITPSPPSVAARGDFSSSSGSIAQPMVPSFGAAQASGKIASAASPSAIGAGGALSSTSSNLTQPVVPASGAAQASGNIPSAAVPNEAQSQAQSQAPAQPLASFQSQDIQRYSDKIPPSDQSPQNKPYLPSPSTAYISGNTPQAAMSPGNKSYIPQTPLANVSASTVPQSVLNSNVKPPNNSVGTMPQSLAPSAVKPPNSSVDTVAQSVVIPTAKSFNNSAGSVPHAPQQSVRGSSIASISQPMTSKQSDSKEPNSVPTQNQIQPQPTSKNTYTTTPGLPTGWEKVVDPNSSRIYYKDHNTQTTHWTAPRSVRKPEAPPGAPVSSAAAAIIPSARSQQGLPSNQQAPKLQESRKELNKLEDTLPEAKKPGLRRSLSSPNLAKLSQGDSLPKVQSKPSFDRTAKPFSRQQTEKLRPIVNRGMKPLSMQTLDSLSPVHGGSGTGLTGLRNLGNTCYMNSVIQCLSNMAPLAAYFISGTYVEDLNRNNSMGTRGELCEQFSILVRVLHSGQFRYVSPILFKKTVGRFKSDFAGFDQQDSQELLAFLMEALHEDTNRVLEKPIVKPPADDLEANEAAEVAWNNHKMRNRSLMVELFDGIFKSTVRCLTCQKESVTFETFSNLTLPLPPHTNRCSLEDCVKLFSKPERMAGDDKWRCPNCKVYRDASKRIQIWKLPPILIVHLKRFQYEGMWRQKIQADVKCPLHNLQLADYAVGPGSSKTYRLYAVSNHYGTMHGGHYTAFCKSVYNEKWYKFDDQFVSPMAVQDVMTSAAYLLFYTSFDFAPPKVLL